MDIEGFTTDLKLIEPGVDEEQVEASFAEVTGHTMIIDHSAMCRWLENIFDESTEEEMQEGMSLLIGHELVVSKTTEWLYTELCELYGGRLSVVPFTKLMQKWNPEVSTKGLQTSFKRCGVSTGGVLNLKQFKSWMLHAFGDAPASEYKEGLVDVLSAAKESLDNAHVTTDLAPKSDEHVQEMDRIQREMQALLESAKNIQTPVNHKTLESLEKVGLKANNLNAALGDRFEPEAKQSQQPVLVRDITTTQSLLDAEAKHNGPYTPMSEKSISAQTPTSTTPKVDKALEMMAYYESITPTRRKLASSQNGVASTPRSQRPLPSVPSVKKHPPNSINRALKMLEEMERGGGTNDWKTEKRTSNRGESHKQPPVLSSPVPFMHNDVDYRLSPTKDSTLQPMTLTVWGA